MASRGENGLSGTEKQGRRGVPLEIKQLRAFLAVASAQSFLRAADELYVTRQAVSKTVTQLEDDLGVKLFVRSQNGASLTPAGAYFYPQARTLVADFDRLEREMTELENRVRPKVRICMAVGVSSMYSRLVAEYAAAHEDEMEIVVSSCPDSECGFVLDNFRADIVLSFTPINARNTTTSLIRESRIVYLVNRSNPLSKNEYIELSWRHRVAKFLLYTGGRDHCLWWPVVPRQGDTTCSDIDYLFQLLREDRGVLPIPVDMAPDSLDYAVTLPGKPRVDPARVYCTTLRPTYYDPVTAILVARVCNELLHQPTENE